MKERVPVLLKVPSTHVRFNEIVIMVSKSLRESGMSFVFRPIGSTVVLNELDILGIYPHLPAIVLNAQIAQFAHKELGLWIVEGDMAVELVANLKGSDNDPSKCAPNTWRFKIGSMLGVRRMNLYVEYGKLWVTVFDNFIHAPKRDEVGRDMSVLNKFVC